ncbi:hypothetical protein BB039_08405 [Neisseria gonorrhoeae]|uniref:Uncharacterized protein n=2 Tax=Neisseria gonorrhoeae TaxID=485 RepID=A0AA44U9X6_NEIGO|nr:Hypothetical protein NGK_1578 [Neisseria gonorrhoeae NCCP11945]ANJ50399.1 hypothetical protein A9Y60_07260 [Neisseria gonorrhoeae]APW53790.1 hypothetical protein T556_08190 [Neisseria gonorrhoeae NG-k51.05]KLR75671.1 hypothetical protein M717_13155 [Neisseria gonorrhoeae SK33414]KLR90392.1 hypothetical protein M702_09225 [Neisseria gonorrhoeae SK28355]KLR95441.1 hypothetical protein M685_00815 [Neisseria gonorrhoeae SK16259]KLS00111.1 hypothetical protein M683_06840 [Neisseria gonorrhoeae 
MSQAASHTKRAALLKRRRRIAGRNGNSRLTSGKPSAKSGHSAHCLYWAISRILPPETRQSAMSKWNRQIIGGIVSFKNLHCAAF